MKIVTFVVKSFRMKKLLIVFHSMTGGAYQMAQAAASGAESEPEVVVNLIHAAKLELTKCSKLTATFSPRRKISP